jgi:transposase
MARFRRTTARGKTYLQYVSSYRNEKKQPATKVIANLGNISDMSESDIERLTVSFLKAVKAEDKFPKSRFRLGKGYHYGTCLPAIAIWERLGLERIINNAISNKVKIPVSKITLIQIANRFSEPGSKLACYRWHSNSMFSQLKDFVKLPDKEEEKLHTYYRSLDYLCSAKEEIEKELYYELKSYGMDNRLVFYDITSVYFEGLYSELGENGHSRDNRPDAQQIVIGLVMSRDGIPIAHHVFEGNRADKTTVEEVIEDLENRFSIKEVVFVGDRGMLTIDNIECVKSRGNNYMLGMQKRNRRIIKYIMKRIDKQKEFQEITYADLNDVFKKEYSKNVRFVACYNPEVAKLNKATREKNIGNFEELINENALEGKLDVIKESHFKIKSYLSKYHMTRFYKLKIDKIKKEETTESKAAKARLKKEEIYKLHIDKQESAILEEADLDGRYFIQTEVDKREFPTKEVVVSYKSLQKVERAFRIIKNELDIRPVFVRLETRIRGHVMICFFALLIEILLEKKLRELFPELEDDKTRKANLKKYERTQDDSLTMKTLMEELDTIRLIPLFINDNVKPEYITTKIGNNVKKFFSSIGIKNSMYPKKLRIDAREMNGEQNQLELIFGE